MHGPKLGVDIDVKYQHHIKFSISAFSAEYALMYSIRGELVSVIEGSEEHLLAILHGAIPMPYATFMEVNIINKSFKKP